MQQHCKCRKLFCYFFISSSSCLNCHQSPLNQHKSDMKKEKPTTMKITSAIVYGPLSSVRVLSCDIFNHFLTTTSKLLCWSLGSFWTIQRNAHWKNCHCLHTSITVSDCGKLPLFSVNSINVLSPLNKFSLFQLPLEAVCGCWCTQGVG